MDVIYSLILFITGVIAVYNVNCLTKENCNAWVVLVALLFLFATFLQLRKQEGLEITIPDEVKNYNKENGSSMPDEFKNYNEKYSGTFLPNPADIEFTIKDNGSDFFTDLKNTVAVVNSFIPDVKDKFSYDNISTIFTSLIPPKNTGVLSNFVNKLEDIFTSVANQADDVFSAAKSLSKYVVDILKGDCTVSIEDLKGLIDKIKKWEEIVTKYDNLIKNPPDLDLDKTKDEAIEFELNKIWDGVTDPY